MARAGYWISRTERSERRAARSGDEHLPFHLLVDAFGYKLIELYVKEYVGEPMDVDMQSMAVLADKLMMDGAKVVDPDALEELQRLAAKRNPRKKKAKKRAKKNPIGKRLEYVRKQYKPEVFDLTQEFVAHALKVSPEEIDPARREEWETTITWLATQINRLLKARDKGGANVEHELRVLKRSYLDTVKPFFGRPKRKGVKLPELAQMSPQEARKYGARKAEGRFEKKQSQADVAGYRIVKSLGGGYVAVEGMPNLNVPLTPTEIDDGMEQWVEENAKFQQWLGVTMKNCLQIYEVNYVAYGYSKFEIQREGGKLYAILDPTGRPVVAALTNGKGQVIEINGPNNRPPPESAQPYLEKFEKVMGWGAGANAQFLPPRGFALSMAGAIEGLLDSEYFTDDLRARRQFIRKVQGYSRQAGADFSKAWPIFAVYILEESRHSLLNTAQALEQDALQRKGLIDVIQRVARLYRNDGTTAEFTEAEATADEIRSAPDLMVITELAARATMRASTAAKIGELAAGWSASSFVRLATVASGGESMASEHAKMVETAQDYATKFLELMREGASDAGRNLQQGGPRRNPRGRIDGLIATCQANWEHYLARPGKKRLKAVLEHLEVMKPSKSAKVRMERRRCLRVANSEAKELGL